MNTAEVAINPGRIDINSELGFAVLCSIFLHMLIFLLVPWLEQESIKPARVIEATISIVTAPSPVQQPIEPTPPQPVVEPKPQAIQPQKPIQQKPVERVPVLSTQAPTESTYEVPQTQHDVAPSSTPTEATATDTPTQSSASSSAQTNHEVQTKAPPTNTDEWDESLYNSYGKSLQKQCERNKQYPAIAVRRSLEGSGVVVVKFNAGGQLQSVTIEQSSGHKPLDDQAIVMVKKSLSDLPLPAKLKGRDFTISVPFEFKLE